MYQYDIDKMSEKIFKELNVDVKPILQEYWENKIAIVWGTEDVIDYVREKDGKEISEEKAREILIKIHSNHDAEQGVNWGVIDYYVNE